MFKHVTSKQFILSAILMAGISANIATGQGMAKSQVGNLIKQVEDGTDKFRDYLEKRGDTAKDSPAAKNGQTPRGRNGRSKEQRQNEERCVGGFAGRIE
jgi:hypothetical protein